MDMTCAEQSEWCAAVARLYFTGGTQATVKKQREVIRAIICSGIERLPLLEGGVNNLFQGWVTLDEARALTLDDEDVYSIVPWLSWRESCIGAGDEATDKATVGYDAAEALYTRPRSAARGGRGRGVENTGRASDRASGRVRPPRQDELYLLKYKALKVMLPLACAGKLSSAQTSRVVAAATHIFDVVYPTPPGAQLLPVLVDDDDEVDEDDEREDDESDIQWSNG